MCLNHDFSHLDYPVCGRSDIVYDPKKFQTKLKYSYGFQSNSVLMLQPLKNYLYFNLSYTTKRVRACFCTPASWLVEKNQGTLKGVAYVWS